MAIRKLARRHTGSLQQVHHALGTCNINLPLTFISPIWPHRRLLDANLFSHLSQGRLDDVLVLSNIHLHSTAQYQTLTVSTTCYMISCCVRKTVVTVGDEADTTTTVDNKQVECVDPTQEWQQADSRPEEWHRFLYHIRNNITIQRSGFNPRSTTRRALSPVIYCHGHLNTLPHLAAGEADFVLVSSQITRALREQNRRHPIHIAQGDHHGGPARKSVDGKSCR